MALKDICVDKEIGIELKEKGFPQDNLLCYFICMKGYEDQYPTGYSLHYCDSDRRPEYDTGAPTAEELLKELPKNFDKKYLGIAPSLNNDAYGVYYMSASQNIEIMKEDKKLCNALAKMWINLKDNNLLKEK